MNHLHPHAHPKLPIVKHGIPFDTGSLRRTVANRGAIQSAHRSVRPGDWLWPVAICALMLLAGLEGPAAPATAVPARGAAQADEVVICYGERQPSCQRLAETHLAARTARVGTPLP